MAASLLAERLMSLAPAERRAGPAMLRARIVPLVVLIAAFSQSWIAGLILARTAPLIPVFMALIGWAAQDASRAQIAEAGALNGLLIDHLAALEDLRVLGAVPRAARALAVRSEGLRAAMFAVLKIAFLSSTVLELLRRSGWLWSRFMWGLRCLG